MTKNSDQMELRRNLLVVPYTSHWVGGPDHANIPPHGRLNVSGVPIDVFPDLPPETHAEATRLSGRYLYGGPLFHHFGHIMADSIIRLWAYDPAVHKAVVFAGVGRKATPLPAMIRDILAVFGITPDQIIIVHAPTVIEEMDFAMPGATLGSHPEDWYLDYLETFSFERKPTGAKLYLGRHHMLQQGTVMGESYFSTLLCNAGFTYYKPENHPIQDQAAAIYGAEKIVFVEGSSIYSIELLARSCANFYMIPRRSIFHNRFRRQIEKRAEFNLLGEPQNVIRLENRNGIVNPDSPSYLLKPELVFADMKRLGLIGDATFSQAEYTAAEAADTKQYFSQTPEKAVSQLDHIGKMRRSANEDAAERKAI